MDEHTGTARRLLGATGEAQPSKADAVARALRAAVAVERERCAGVCKQERPSLRTADRTPKSVMTGRSPTPSMRAALPSGTRSGGT